MTLIDKNPMEGKKVVFIIDESEPKNADGACGHLEVIGETEHKASFYEAIVKRLFDIVISLLGMIILSPLFLFLSIWILIDDPGPILFTQNFAPFTIVRCKI